MQENITVWRGYITTPLVVRTIASKCMMKHEIGKDLEGSDRGEILNQRLF
jgi:hypothetical protein